MKLLLPAIFLLVLGIGNLWVGYFKERQYELVYEELRKLESSTSSSTPINTPETNQNIAERHARRKREVEERQGFYSLVSFGGKAICSLSLLLFTAAIASQLIGTAPSKETRKT